MLDPCTDLFHQLRDLQHIMFEQIDLHILVITYTYVVTYIATTPILP